MIEISWNVMWTYSSSLVMSQVANQTVDIDLHKEEDVFGPDICYIYYD